MDSFVQNVFTIIGFGAELFFVETGVCIRRKVGDEMDIREIDGLWCDDITFCPYKGCRRKTCPRNQMHIRDKSIPHSYFVERPPDCPYRKRQDEFYHVRKKGGDDA